jgi:hypothetical protein
MEIITGGDWRRRWSLEEKLRMVVEAAIWCRDRLNILDRRQRTRRDQNASTFKRLRAF